MSSSFGSIQVADGVVAQSLSTAAAKVTAFAANGAKSSYDIGGDQSVVPDVANDRLRVVPGVYKVTFHASFTVGAAQNYEFHCRTKVGAGAAAEVGNLGCELTGTAAATKVSSGFAGILNLLGVAPGTDGMIDLELWGESNAAGGANITMDFGNFTAERLDV